MRINLQNKKLLLHTCCAPCGCASLERVLHESFEVTLFFSNSNIYPYSEYLKRLEYVNILADYFKVPLLIDSYNHELWLERVKGLEKEPEGANRCFECFKFNLEKAAAKTKEFDNTSFTTTLSISPLKNSKKIFMAAASFENFIQFDFKKQNGYLRSIELSKQLNLYRQNYCGCEFSKKN